MHTPHPTTRSSVFSVVAGVCDPWERLSKGCQIPKRKEGLVAVTATRKEEKEEGKITASTERTSRGTTRLSTTGPSPTGMTRR